MNELPWCTGSRSAGGRMPGDSAASRGWSCRSDPTSLQGGRLVFCKKCWLHCLDLRLQRKQVGWGKHVRLPWSVDRMPFFSPFHDACKCQTVCPVYLREHVDWIHARQRRFFQTYHPIHHWPLYPTSHHLVSWLRHQLGLHWWWVASQVQFEHHVQLR